MTPGLAWTKTIFLGNLFSYSTWKLCYIWLVFVQQHYIGLVTCYTDSTGQKHAPNNKPTSFPDLASLPCTPIRSQNWGVSLYCTLWFVIWILLVIMFISCNNLLKNHFIHFILYASILSIYINFLVKEPVKVTVIFIFHYVYKQHILCSGKWLLIIVI